MAVWYPRARATLIVQFDEQGQPIDPRTQILGPVVPKSVSGARFSTLAALDLMDGNPLGHSFDVTEFMHLEIAENGYRTADTAELTLDFSKMPFTDPRMIRAMGLIAYGGAVGPDNADSPLPPSADSIMFVGFLDDLEDDFEDGVTAKLKFRDYTALFIDTEQPDHLDLRGNLQTVLERILGAEDAPWAGINLELRGLDMLPELTEEVLQKNQLPDILQRQQKGPDGTTPAMPALGKTEGGTPLSTWDVICELCNIFAVVPTITLSNGGTGGGLGPGRPTPKGMPVLAVGPARAVITPQTPARTLVYGRNLKDLKIKRKFGNLTVPQIVVKSYDPSHKKTVVGRYPPRGNPQNPAKVYPSGRKASETPKTLYYEGLKDEKAAERAAFNVWNQIGRQELGGSFATDDMASFIALPEQSPERYAEAAAADDLSLLKAKPGDPVRIVIAEDNPDVPGPRSASAYGELLALSTEEIVRRLTDQGYRPRVASLIARYLKGGVLQQMFVIRSSRKVFDHDDGFSYAAEFMNYIELHQDPNVQRQTPQNVPRTASIGVTKQGGKLKGRQLGSLQGTSRLATERHRR